MPVNFRCCLPTRGGTLNDELRQCLKQAAVSIKEGLIPVRLNIYADLPNFDSVGAARTQALELVREEFGGLLPAVNLTAHPPVKPWKVAIEAAFVSSESCELAFNMHGSVPYVTVNSSCGRELIAAGVSTYSFPSDTRLAASEAFRLMVEMLEKENFTLNNIIRQWNYIGNILEIRDGLQNYQVFNEVRSEYYGKYRSAGYFPAATGVGMKHGGVILDFNALDPAKGLSILPVHNPNQVDAYKYGQQVLKGAVEKGKSTKHPPQFERALLTGNDEKATLLISGTASIIGQETIGKGNVEEQTHVTISNIRKLSDEELLRSFIGFSGPVSLIFSVLRIYVKEQKDFDIAAAICAEEFPCIPSIFIEADICRDDLLIEIEAVAEVMPIVRT
jgi:enamine deaminase RidA (YjgF/YER057c/UK114 family)